MQDLLISIFCFGGIAALLYHEHKLELRENREKFGMTKKEFRHYRKMMTSSTYRTAQKQKRKWMI
jgi:hypothetical protein